MSEKSRLLRALEESKAGLMGPRPHKVSEVFDITESEVAKYLCSRPEVMRAVFDVAKENGFIVYNRETGLWRGCLADLCEDVKA